MMQRGNRQWVPAKIVNLSDRPRSYVVQDGAHHNIKIRNKCHLKPRHCKRSYVDDDTEDIVQENVNTTTHVQNTQTENNNHRVTRSGLITRTNSGKLKTSKGVLVLR